MSVLDKKKGVSLPAAIAVFAVAAAFGFWLFNREEPSFRDSRRYAEAIVTGEGLRGLTVVDAHGKPLSPETTQKLRALVVGSALEGCTVSQSASKRETAERVEAWAEFRCPDGRSGAIHTRALEAPDGPRINVSSLLFQGWIARCKRSGRDKPSVTAPCIVEGLRRDGAALRQLGIDELPRPQGGVADLAEVERIWQAIADHK